MKPTTDLQTLIDSAIAVSQHAYIPYSGYAVGAALRDSNGIIHTGCNVENAVYPATICAERSALVKAISAGQREFTAIVVATRDGGSPCGICRQMLNEFAPEMAVILVDFDGNIHLETTLADLLPHSFGPANVNG